jgi:hypothetical protein
MDCTHEDQPLLEYWHENDDCGVEDCKVDECRTCGSFTTDCWEDWQSPEYRDSKENN